MNPVIRKLSGLSGSLALLAAFLFVFLQFGAKTGLAFGGTRAKAPLSQPSPVLSFDPSLLLKQFEAAQRREMNRLMISEKQRNGVLKASQAARKKEFDRQEKAARRQFFAADHPGSEKRDYMRALIARREALHRKMADARAKAKEDSDIRVQALRDEQQLKLNKFRSSIRRYRRPDDSLWPQPTLETD